MASAHRGRGGGGGGGERGVWHANSYYNKPVGFACMIHRDGPASGFAPPHHHHHLGLSPNVLLVLGRLADRGTMHALPFRCYGVLIGAILQSDRTTNRVFRVEEGEVSSSLVGPFVGFHHQALLVAAFWPEGRGNIGYGANVGSNHTGKRNDQEIWPGEGVFYGLGCSIKYPCNLSEAPYTLVATGVTALPQRLSMPFSLMNTPGERIPGVSPSFNEVMPGWVLSDNMYGVFRNTIKFEKRQAAALRRDARAAPSGTVFGFTTEIVRQDTVTLMVTARAALVRVAGKHRLHTAAGHPVYTDSDLAGGLGIGKNYMLEKSRAAAVATYSTYIEFFALQQICKAMQAGRVSLAEVTELLQARATAATATGKHRGAPSLKNKPKTKAMPATGGDLSYRQLGSQFVSLSLTRQAKPPAVTLDAGHAYAMELLSQDPALLGGVVTGERWVLDCPAMLCVSTWPCSPLSSVKGRSELCGYWSSSECWPKHLGLYFVA